LRPDLYLTRRGATGDLLTADCVRSDGAGHDPESATNNIHGTARLIAKDGVVKGIQQIRL
jgi:hypothetical protein